MTARPHLAPFPKHLCSCILLTMPFLLILYIFKAGCFLHIFPLNQLLMCRYNAKHYLFCGFPASPNRSPFSYPCSHSIVSIKNQNRTAEVMSRFKTKLFAYMQIYMQFHCSSWKAMKRFCVAMYKKSHIDEDWGEG